MLVHINDINYQLYVEICIILHLHIITDLVLFMLCEVISNMNNRLKELRNSINMTPEEFGRNIGISGSLLLEMENNMIVITDKIVDDICRTFNVNYDWLKYGVVNNNYIDLEHELINCIKDDLKKALISIDNTLVKQLLTNITKLLHSSPLDRTEECILSYKNELESEKKELISLVLQNIKDTEVDAKNEPLKLRFIFYLDLSQLNLSIMHFKVFFMYIHSSFLCWKKLCADLIYVHKFRICDFEHS